MEFCSGKDSKFDDTNIDGIGIFGHLPSFECYVQVTFIATYGLVIITALLLYFLYQREANFENSRKSYYEKKAVERMMQTGNSISKLSDKHRSINFNY